MAAQQSSFRVCMGISLLGMVILGLCMAWSTIQMAKQSSTVAGLEVPRIEQATQKMEQAALKMEQAAELVEHAVSKLAAQVAQRNEQPPATASQYDGKPESGSTPPSTRPQQQHTGDTTITSPAASPGNKTYCDNTCPTARNGVCDEGRSAGGTAVPLEAELRVLCDLGTDCDDCGSWEGAVHSNTWTGPQRPVELLRGLGHEIWTRQAQLPTLPDLSFWMAYTNWSHDVDVSSQMHFSAFIELGITKVFRYVSHEQCGQSPPGLFLDVGANFGWYTLLMATMGCRVIAWEPVPHFRAFLEYGLARNSLLSRVDVRTTVVTHDSSRAFEMVVPQRGIWGTAGIGGKNIDGAIDNKGDYLRLNVSAQTLDEEVQQDVTLLKVDVEGFEPDVMAGAQKLLVQHTVQNIIMEYSPGVIERSHNWLATIRMPEMLLSLKKAGYTILNLDSEALPLMEKEAVPALNEVTAANLKYDVRDMELMANGTLGCGMPKELYHFPAWINGACKAIPEDLSPRSFHSVFGHNTNIWAARSPPPGAVGPPVGVIPLDAPVGNWTGGPIAGVGGKTCQHARPDQWVRLHCPCPNVTLCGEEEKAVLGAALKGLMPSMYILPA